MPISQRQHDPLLYQIVNSPSDSDYLDQLIISIRDYSHRNRVGKLLHRLKEFGHDRETDIGTICTTRHQDFVSSVNQLLSIRTNTLSLTSEILDLNQSIRASTERLAERKRALVESRGHRQNIADTAQALDDCLVVLRSANQVYDLLANKSHYAALRALDELQNVHLTGVTDYKIADLILRSIPATQKAIAEDVMRDLHGWLSRIREMSQYLGEVALHSTNLRKERLRMRAEKIPNLRFFSLNSPIELVSDELEEYDLLADDALQMDVEFTPLFECLHIHESLGEVDQFCSEYGMTRRKQMELLLPPSISLTDEDRTTPNLHSLLEEIAGFAIVERSTVKRLPNLRSSMDVDDLWDVMCRNAVALMKKALPAVDDAADILKIKNLVILFMQTMNTLEFPVVLFDKYLLTMFEDYTAILKKKFEVTFDEILATDDYMPMPVQNADEYQKVVEVSWYTPPMPIQEKEFPSVLPFSPMYPLCCMGIRDFIGQFYSYSEDDFDHFDVVDEAIRTHLDDLLCNKVCDVLDDRLKSQYLGQIVQIFINMEHFNIACQEIERLLAAARANGELITLKANTVFKEKKKVSEKRIFELVNLKIDDLIDTAEYVWMAPAPPFETSNYMQTLTRFLSNIMSSTLQSLPTEIKELVYFDALSHTASRVLSLPLASDVATINMNAVSQLAMDVDYLMDFVNNLNVPILRENLDELQQTVQLMQSDNTDEFYDISTRNKKYGRVDALNGPILLEKVVREAASTVSSPQYASSQTSSVKSPSKTDKIAASISHRFGRKT